MSDERDNGQKTVTFPELVFCALGPVTAIVDMDSANLPWFIPDTREYKPAIFVLYREGHA